MTLPAFGWFPTLSPDGRYCAGGGYGASAFVLEVGSQKVLRNLPASFRMIGWRDARTCVALGEGATYTCSAPAFEPVEALAFDGNSGGAGGGAWVQSFQPAVRPHVLYWNGRPIFEGPGIFDARMDREGYAATSDGTWLYLFKDARLFNQFRPIGNTNTYRVGAGGYIGYGYYGRAWVSDPTGQSVECTVTPDRQECPPLPFRYNGALWLASPCERGIHVRPLGDRAVFTVPTESIWCDVAVVADHLVVASCTGAGRFALQTVSATTPRKVLEAPAPPPPPVKPKPERPRVTIESYWPSSGRAPLKVRAVCRLSGGPADRLTWRYRLQGGAWKVSAVNPASDGDHTYPFTEPGLYELGVDVVGPGGSDGTGEPRYVRVS